MNATTPLSLDDLRRWPREQRKEMLLNLVRLAVAEENESLLMLDAEPGSPRYVIAEIPEFRVRVFTPGHEDPELMRLSELASDPKNRAPFDDAFLDEILNSELSSEQV